MDDDRGSPPHMQNNRENDSKPTHSVPFGTLPCARVKRSFFLVVHSAKDLNILEARWLAQTMSQSIKLFNKTDSSLKSKVSLLLELGKEFRIKIYMKNS